MANRNEIQQSLVQSEDDAVQHQPQPQPQPAPSHNNASFFKKLKYIPIIVAISAFIIVGIVIICIPPNDAQPDGMPIDIQISLPIKLQIQLGSSRVVQVIYYSGNDDRNSDDFEIVTKRDITWSAIPEGIVSIDDYGRLEAISPGNVTIKVQSALKSDVYDQSTIEVIPKQKFTYGTKKRIIDFGLTPAKTNNVFQKIVSFLTKQEALISQIVPQNIKEVINKKAQFINKQVSQGDITWTIRNYADKSNRSYVKRFDPKAENKRDTQMYFIGNRYLAESGIQVISIEDDNELGIWTVNSNGSVTRIALKSIDYIEKAKLMVKDTQNYVLRHGLASGSRFNGEKWIGEVMDNDGLWTSMYCSGQLMRYHSMKTMKSSDEQIAIAKASALTSLKAVLLIANIPSRDGMTNARIRHLINARSGQCKYASSHFLKQNRPFSFLNYAGSPADGVGFYGSDAGKIIKGSFYGGIQRYTYDPVDISDWSNDSKIDTPATSKRTLNGFLARTFMVQPLDGAPLPTDGGLYFRHLADKTQQVISGAHNLYDYTNDQHPILDLGRTQLPQILKDFLKIDGVQYNITNMIYKGQTSSDQIIGHLFIYKIAFDILDQADEEEKTLKMLIVSTMDNFCNCLVNNGYTMVDATGQGTSWAKLTRDFLNTDYTIQDAPLKAIQLLMSFKLCNYLTNNNKWQKQYEFLIQDPSYRYLDLSSLIWQRWTYRSFNEDLDLDNNLLHLDSNTKYSEIELINHIMNGIHYSDQEEAFLAFYLIFQLQDDENYLKEYRKAIDGWWNSISRSQNPLWYYIYQLAYPDKIVQDNYGNNILETASWALSRHQISTIKTQAFIQGSRSDVWLSGQNPALSQNPQKIIGRRKHISDAKYASRSINYEIDQNYDPLNIYEIKVLPADERSIHKFNGATFQSIHKNNDTNSMEPSTTYTLPFWLGVYHKMINLE